VHGHGEVTQPHLRLRPVLGTAN